MSQWATILGLVPPALQVCLAVVLLRRKSYRTYPFFLVYTLFAVGAEVCKLVLLFMHQQNTLLYFYGYWSAEAIYAALGFAAIHEVFRTVFEGFMELAWFRFLLPSIALLMLGVSILLPQVHPSVETRPIEEIVFSLQVAVRCLQLGIFVLIFGLARFFDLDYRQYAFGIAAGFGIAATGILLATMVRTALGLKSLIFFQYAPAVAYCVAVTVWLASFVRPEPDDPFRDFRHLFTPELFLAQLQRYKQEVKGIFRP